MRPVTVYRYWWFGTCVRFLQDASENASIHGSGHILANIESLFDRVDQLGLNVTKRACTPLLDLQTTLKGSEAGAKLSAAQARELRQVVTNLRLTMEAELRGIEAYVLNPKRHDLQKLLNDVPALFAPDVFDSLNSLAQHDLTEAAQCIAFERPTAAAFHLMRATEGVFRDLYCHFVKRDRIDPLLWYPMLQALQKHRKAKVHDALLRNLDNIRLSFRNPTQHPDKIYDIHEAQDLFGLCVDVINRIQRIIIGAEA
jgi:hypothetical protein